MTSKMEVAAIKAQLALRFNPLEGCWEVHTTIHGSGIFKWYKISEQEADWYSKKFYLTKNNPGTVDIESGAFHDYSMTPIKHSDTQVPINIGN